MNKLKTITSLAVASVLCASIVSADISVKFDSNILQKGENKFEIFGSAGESGSFDLLYGIYEDGRLSSVENIGTYNITAGAAFSETGSITIDGGADLASTSVKVSLVRSGENPVPISEEFSVKGVSFSYTLTEDLNTSAGVYDKNGRLVRTLWGGLSQKAGSYTKAWDGKDDYGRYLPDGEYTVKVLSNNVKYIQDGAVGNNSDVTGLMYNLSDYSPFSDMTYHNGTMYYAQAYSETHYTQRAFAVSNPYRLARYTSARPQNPYKCATDGERVYYLNFQALMPDKTLLSKSDKVNQRFVSALDIISNTEYEFTDTASAIPLYNYGQVSFNSTVAREEYGKGENRAGGAYYGEVFMGDIDVNTANPYLAVTYPSRDYVTVINKYSGTTLKKNPLTNPTSIVFDNSGKLWVLSGNNAKDLSLYTVSSDGTMTKTVSAPSTVATSEVIAIDISPKGDEMAVVYGGETNKVIGYNTADWSINWTYGSGESYKTDPTVKDDKLMFMAKTAYIRFGNPLKSIDYSFVTYESDNKVWFGDTGNTRHMSININSGTPVAEDIVYVRGCNYNSSVVLNDPSRVFSGELEYEIDYSNATGDNSYWKLKNNWSYIMLGKFAKAVQTSYHYINDMVKLSNGRTYFAATALDGENDPYLDIEDLPTDAEKTALRNAKKEDFYLWELTETGVRNTGVSLNGCSIVPDGKATIQYIDYVEIDNKKEKGLYQKYVTGFDENNNPIYSAPVYVGSIPRNSLNGYTLDEYIPVDENGNVYTFFRATRDSGGVSYARRDRVDMRVASYNPSEGGFVWKAAPATSDNYSGDFPRDGAFEIGNSVGNTVRQIQKYGNNIMLQYFGEGYKGGQTNVFYHFNDDGLLIGVFGDAIWQQANYEDYGQEMVNGNGFCWQMVKSPAENDVYYIYQGGESRFNGVVRTRVEGLDSIKIQTVPIYLKNNLSGGLVKNSYQTDKMNTDEKSQAQIVVSTAKGINDSYFTLKGYIKAPENINGELKLLFCSDGDIQVKIDEKEFASGSDMVLAGADFEKGMAYPVEITVKNNSNFKLLYSDENGQWTDYPYSCMFSDVGYNYVLSKENNLLENIPFDTTVMPEQVGWSFTNVTGTPKITSNLHNYKPYDDNDISISFVGEKNVPYYAEKTLDTDDKQKAIWEVNADMMWLGSLSGHYDTYNGDLSRYIDILDINGKVIARVDCRYEDFSPYGNNVKIADLGVPADYTTVKAQYIHPLSTPFNLRIVGENGKISFSFNGKTVTADSVYESGASWNMPKTIRLYNNRTYSNQPEFQYRFLKLRYYEYSKEYQNKVEFYDENGSLIQTTYVKSGEGAVPPAVERKGYRINWDKETDCVNEDIKVYMSVTKDETLYSVRFYDENRQYIETKTASYGEGVASPLGEISGYKLFWRDTNGRHIDISSITKNVSVYACYDKLVNMTEDFADGDFYIVYPTKDGNGNKLQSGQVETTSGFNFSLNDSAYGLTAAEDECLYVNGTRVGAYDPNLLRINFPAVKSDKVSIKFKTKITHYTTVAGAKDFGAVYDSQGNCVAKIGGSNSGIYVFNGVNMADKLTYDTKSWHEIEYKLDFKSRTFNLIFDGTTYGPYKMADYRASDAASVYFIGSDTSSSNNAMNWYMEYITVSNQ